MARDMKERKCGCIVFDVGPPVLCDTHKFKLEQKEKKAEKKAAREEKREQKGLRKTVEEQATELGHDLSRFKEYPSVRGKWTAHCHRCGGIVIVYDGIPERGDQVAGAVFKKCERSSLVDVLGSADRDGFAARFAGTGAAKEPEPADEENDDGPEYHSVQP